MPYGSNDNDNEQKLLRVKYVCELSNKETNPLRNKYQTRQDRQVKLQTMICELNQHVAPAKWGIVNILNS